MAGSSPSVPRALEVAAVRRPYRGRPFERITVARRARPVYAPFATSRSAAVFVVVGAPLVEPVDDRPVALPSEGEPHVIRDRGVDVCELGHRLVPITARCEVIDERLMRLGTVL